MVLFAWPDQTEGRLAISVGPTSVATAGLSTSGRRGINAS